MTGNRVTARVMDSQNPCSVASGLFSENLLMKGTVSKSILGPSSASTAGSRVRVAASEASTTRMAPRASDW